MKIAILTCGMLPLPAVQGGAVENKIDFILEYNEFMEGLTHKNESGSISAAFSLGYANFSNNANNYDKNYYYSGKSKSIIKNKLKEINTSQGKTGSYYIIEKSGLCQFLGKFNRCAYLFCNHPTALLPRTLMETALLLLFPWPGWILFQQFL